MDKKSLMIAIILIFAFATMSSATVRAENYTVTINSSIAGSGATGTIINFMGTNVAVSQLPRQFSVANGTNAAYSWQPYVSVNSTYRFAFVNASKSTMLVTCTGGTPPICLYLPFTTNISQTGTVLITTNTTLMAYYSPEVYLQYTAPSGGSTNITSGWYAPGTIIGLSATPNSGYKFDGWSVTGSLSVQNSSASVTTLTINGPGTITANFAVVSPPPSGFPMEYIILIVAVVAVLGIAGAFLMRRKPKPPPAPKPAALRLAPEKNEIFADGRSSTEIAVEIVDNEGKPIASETDREVYLSATDGTIQQSVKIPKGASSARVTLSSSMKVGQVNLTASSKDLASAQATVSFVEKKRYCMICGQRIPIDAKLCPSCGSAPPSGADTKTCPNCGAVIPVVAKFCRECGARQPA